MPWFAWIAIVAIVIWGAVMIVSMAMDKELPGTPGEDPKEIEKLRQRIEELESGEQAPDTTEPTSDLAERLDRIERRLDRRESRDLEHDDWNRQARELGLGQEDPDSRRDTDGNPER